MAKPIRKLLTEEQKLFIPAMSFTLAMCLIIGFETFILPVNPDFRMVLLACSGLGAIYTLVIFFYVLRFIRKNSIVNWLLAVLNGVFVSVGMIFAPSFARELSLTFTAVIIIASTIFLGRWPTYAFSLLCFISDRFLFSQSTSFTGLNFLIEYLPIPIFSIVAVETICRMLKTARLQVHRLEVLNIVAKSVTSSIEIKQVIALLNSTIQNALDADTYYVGLMENDGTALHLELLFDDGEFYPTSYLPLENTLAGWVIHNRKSLFTGNLPEDMPKFGVHRFVVGQSKPSLSWMGTPLQTSERLLGLVAVASYKYYEFGKEDLQLLQNVAQQASLAIDNAYHHAEVEEKSRLDSLTGAFNHRAFIQKLDDTLADAAVTHMPISVIMLDIDNFKSYNDNYGHLFGDKVLSRLTEVIRYHIRENDFVGRWGGEEFSISLQGADFTQVFEIARRIQHSMKEIEFTARDGSLIPGPTVSQGISTFPRDAGSTYSLIDVADQRLYIAKNRGRDQIEPHQEVIGEIIKSD